MTVIGRGLGWPDPSGASRLLPGGAPAAGVGWPGSPDAAVASSEPASARSGGLAALGARQAGIQGITADVAAGARSSLSGVPSEGAGRQDGRVHSVSGARRDPGAQSRAVRAGLGWPETASGEVASLLARRGSIGRPGSALMMAAPVPASVIRNDTGLGWPPDDAAVRRSGHAHDAGHPGSGPLVVSRETLAAPVRGAGRQTGPDGIPAAERGAGLGGGEPSSRSHRLRAARRCRARGERADRGIVRCGAAGRKLRAAPPGPTPRCSVRLVPCR